MSHISKNIINKIKEGQLKPTHKWVVKCKHSIIWGIFALSVVFGSIALSIIFFQFSDADFSTYRQMNNSTAEFILLVLPYFWMILMVVFLGLAYRYFRNTKTGHRYSMFAISVFSLSLSLVLGSLLYASGFTGKLESLFYEIPNYEKLQVGKRIMWQRPQRGTLAGVIVKVEDDKIFVLRDLKEQTWSVDAGSAQIRNDLILRANEHIKMIGESLGGQQFRAQIILPWRRQTTHFFFIKTTIIRVE